MPFALFFTAAPKNYALIKCHIVANFGRFTNDDSHTVIDEDALANLGTRVDLDAGEKAVDMGDQPGDEIKPMSVKEMGHPVHLQCMKPRIAGEHLQQRTSRRIAIKYG